jgi:hypothetical protein
MNIAEIMERAGETALKNGFLVDPIDHHREHLMMVSEVIEAVNHLRDGSSLTHQKNMDGFIPECGDVLLRVLSYLHCTGGAYCPTQWPVDLNVGWPTMFMQVVRLITSAGVCDNVMAGESALSNAVDIILRWFRVRDLEPELRVAIYKKMEYNMVRPVRHGRAF